MKVFHVGRVDPLRPDQEPDLNLVAVCTSGVLAMKAIRMILQQNPSITHAAVAGHETQFVSDSNVVDWWKVGLWVYYRHDDDDRLSVTNFDYLEFRVDVYTIVDNIEDLWHEVRTCELEVAFRL